MKQRIEGRATHTQTFDVEIRLTAVQTITGTTTFAYDNAGRQIASIAPDGKVSRTFCDGRRPVFALTSSSRWREGNGEWVR